MVSLRKTLFKILFNQEFLQLQNLINIQNEQKKYNDEKEILVNSQNITLKEKSKILSDILYRGINHNIKLSIDCSPINEFQYILKDYYLSYYDKYLELTLKHIDYTYVFRYSLSEISDINFSSKNSIITSKIHLTLNSVSTRMYIDWDENTEVPNPNPKFQISEKIYPYKKYKSNTCEYHLEHAKYYEANNRKTSEKYLNDKSNIPIGILHIEADPQNSLGSISSYNYKESTGKLDYISYFSYDESSNPPILIPDYIHILDNNFGEHLENKKQYGNPNSSSRRLGHGSAAIDMLIEYATKNNFKYIDGSLSSVDEQDVLEKEWRDAFYVHKGFEINNGHIKKLIENYKVEVK